MKKYEYEFPKEETLKVWKVKSARQRATEGIDDYYLSGEDEQVFIPEKLRTKEFKNKVNGTTLPW